MSPGFSHDQQVCRHCGTVISRTESVCPGCCRRLVGTVPTPTDSRNMPRFAFLSNLGPFVKILIIVGLLAVPALYLLYAFGGVLKTIEESHPHPTDPMTAVKTFCNSLQNEADEDFKSCIKLLKPSSKIASIAAGLQTREGYKMHFHRIRNYLVKHIGENFMSTLKLTGEGLYYTLNFDDYIELHLLLLVSKGTGGEDHYGIDQIEEFPFSFTSGLGIESRNVRINAAIEDLDSLENPYIGSSSSGFQVPDDPNARGRFMVQMVQAYRFEEQLDTRHDIIDMMFNEFGNEQAALNFFRKIVPQNEKTPHLLELARGHLEQLENN